MSTFQHSQSFYSDDISTGQHSQSCFSEHMPTATAGQYSQSCYSEHMPTATNLQCIFWAVVTTPLNSDDYTAECSTLYLSLSPCPSLCLVFLNEDMPSGLFDDSVLRHVRTIDQTPNSKPKLLQRNPISLESTKLRSCLLRPSAQLP